MSVALIQKEILVKDEEVKQKAAAAEEADSLIEQAQADLKAAEAVRTVAEAANAERAAERLNCVELMEGSYKILREGLWGWDHSVQRQHLTSVQTFLKNLRTVKVSVSLIFVEGPNMLRMKPSQRPDCAKHILLEIDGVFVRHLASVDAELESSASEVADSLQGASNAQAAVAAAKAKSETNLQEQAAADVQSRDLRRTVSDLQKSILEKEVAAQQAEEDALKALGSEHMEVEHWFKEAKGAFVTLRDQDMDCDVCDIPIVPTPSKKRRSSFY